MRTPLQGEREETTRIGRRTKMFDRRDVLKGSVATAAVAAVAGVGPGALAQAKDIKIGMIAPLSGPWARQGELMRMGGDLAIKHINAQGGIKALGGAKLQLLSFDAGDSAEKAKNAAQRMLAQEPDLVAATGAWLSSFTLAVPVTDRVGASATATTVTAMSLTGEAAVLAPSAACAWTCRVKLA